MITKIIWQTHEWEYDDLPDIYKRTSATWQRLNPDWEYRYVSSKQRREQIAAISPILLEKYDLFQDKDKGLNQADFWRMVIVHEYGGVYADMDSVCISTLNDMITIYPDKEMIVTPVFFASYLYDFNHNELIDHILETGENLSFFVNNANFAGKKRNPVLSEIVNSLTNGVTKMHGLYSRTCLKYNDLVAYDFRWAIHGKQYNHEQYQKENV